ncbi:inositol monophosphatase [archaeon]|jgi:myo-inositol-1(or 4)-monophosphatase|nr:inositol monophosphatase [archaeon]MBT6762821.1 inositol monophosphatase [archaeon]
MKYQTFCISIANKAGSIIKKNFNQPMDKEWKKDETPVTITDKIINKLIIKEIHKKFPNHDINGEEESSLSNGSEYVWVCDPVDGTMPFSHGIPTATFSLALVHNGIPIAAVVYDPWIDRMFYAEKGKGCFLNDQIIHVNKNDQLKLSFISVETKKSLNLFDFQKVQATLEKNGVKIVRLRSIIYIGMLVAQGHFSGVIFGGDTCHDAASLKLLIEEAGGKFTDINGEEQRYDQKIKGLVGSNGLIHEKLLKIISQNK